MTIRRARLFLLCIAGALIACDDSTFLPPPPARAPSETELVGDIVTSRTLSAGKDYVLSGVVHVRPGAVLTIEKGTVIKADNSKRAALVVQPGARILAEGTRDEPIVFTSPGAEGHRNAGDWGGIIVLGRAPVATDTGRGLVEGLRSGLQERGEFGGDDEDDDSGVLRYVRIEFGGYVFETDNEINGLTLAGVGRRTVVEYIQVRHTKDDCFEFFGGTVNAKHLACQYPQDDGFDWDLGYRGKLQYLVLQADPRAIEHANGFEGDDSSSTRAGRPFSEPTISNVTLCGPNTNPDKEQHGMLLRTGTRGKMMNVLTMGFEAGIDVRDAATADHARTGRLDIRSSIFFGQLLHAVAYPETSAAAGSPTSDDDGQAGTPFDEAAWLLAPERRNSTEDPAVTGCFDADRPRFGPTVAHTKNASPPPDDGFFDTSAAFVGAFRDASDAWATEGRWAVWSSQ